MKLIKISAVLLSGILLLGAGACDKDEAAPAATDTSTTQQTTATPTDEATNPAQSGTQVLITANGFEPKSVTIKVGETVTWTNQTSAEVRVASDPHPLHTGLPGLDDLSGATQGDTYSFTFTKAGTFGYHDHNNTSVKGTVVVTP